MRGQFPKQPRFTRGLFGLKSNGILCTPSGVPFLWLPFSLASNVHAWLNGWSWGEGWNIREANEKELNK